MKRSIALLTPWYGPECTGGAESLARELAERLSVENKVTILTTTSRSFLHDWDKDFHKAGRSKEGSKDVLRFRVRRRDRRIFNDLNTSLLELPQERWGEVARSRSFTDPFIENSINSPDLENYLARESASHYDAVLALPYLYGVVVRGIAAASGPVHLVPCLHDEAYARIPHIEDAFHKARTLLFNSAGEAALAKQLYGPGILHKSHIVGTGVPPAGEAGPLPPIATSPYYLFLGRRAPEKGLDLLLEAFQRSRGNGHGREIALILAGPGERSYSDPDRGIHDLGFVDEATKRALLRDALALASPSKNESYSRVLMEAWREHTPVIAHADCLATATAVRESRGGLVAGTSDEWTRALNAMHSMEAVSRQAMGASGAEYAAENADWDKALARLRDAIGIEQAASPAPKRGKRIDQVLEAVDEGDAITQQARRIRDRLRDIGYDSNIYATSIPPGVSDAHSLVQSSVSGADALILHHSIGSNAADAVLKARCRKAMVYHNITPARFFAPYAPDVAAQLEQGREQLAASVQKFDILIGASDYNARELVALGAKNVRTLPVVPDLNRFDRTPADGSIRLRRGTTWLFVGRIVPNKGIKALIEAFAAYLRFDDSASLVVLGKFDGGDAYYSELRRSVAEYNIRPYVTFTGYMEDDSVVGKYRSADVFVCLSEHEGFCVPLVEAMFFDVPIVAKALTAVPETLGPAGLILEPGADAFDVAAAVWEVVTNAKVRRTILEAQRERREAFLAEKIDPLIDALGADLIAY
ncbi:MAG TPA: glycosyltransferase [Candidatus Baltobacteraceae bacterium]